MAAKKTISIPPRSNDRLEVKIIGESPLIVHAWSRKAVTQMLAKQMGLPHQARKRKDPIKDYEESIIKTTAGEFGFPSIGVKAAMVRAAKAFGMAMTDARNAIYIPGEHIVIEGTPLPREDMVRLENGVADIRYRACYYRWASTFVIQYDKKYLTSAQVMNLLDNAGFSPGLGEWRPDRNGPFGMFHVARKGEKLKDSCPGWEPQTDAQRVFTFDDPQKFIDQFEDTPVKKNAEAWTKKSPEKKEKKKVG